MRTTVNKQNYILGLDLGSNSIGWACISTSKTGLNGIRDAGTRIFEAGMNFDPTNGKATSRNTERRMARGRRRLLDRKQMRLSAVRTLLQKASLLPVGKPDHSNDEWKKLLCLNPYSLRSKGLDLPLKPYEMGYCLYHIAHRRGFLSNRKRPEGEDEKERSKLKQEMNETDKLWRNSGARTWGEFLSRQDSHLQRVRTKHTMRRWYEEEFETLWTAQASHSPETMTQELKRRVKEAIFFQRPLKSQKHLIGRCELEKQRRRAPMAILEAQRMRILQDINNLRLMIPALGTDRELSKEERIILFSEMDLHEKMTFAKVRSVLNLPRNSRFNLENGDRKALVGNITACRIREAIGETWEAMAEGSRSQMLEDLLTIENAQALAKRGETHWKFDRVAAEHFSEIELEEDYSAFSRHAMRRLLPLLEFGKSITEAILELDPNHGTPPTAMDELPPCENLRNPIVQRTLAELRRIINHLIAVHGKPEAIRIELARDLKQGSKQREESYKRMRLRERNNAAAKARVLTELGGSEVKAWQIERVLLADECQWHCPYTGQPISMAKLLSNESSFDVEHIIPFSRSLDDSFANKTLCLAEENRNRKGNRTPFEAYSSNADSWAAMIGRVEHFQSDYAEEKLRRFLLRDVPGESSFIEDFSSAQLNDTRYMSKKAAEYVGHLYGADFRKHVQVTKGQVTAYLRSAWSLNEILSKSGRKSRDDHRHHAVDAIAVALTTPEMIRKLSEISSGQSRARRFPGMPDPWSGFGSDVRQSIEKMIVSHRVERRVNGQLHKETFYGIIRSREDNKEHAVVRRRIEMLTDKEIKENAIVDPSVRKAVETKLGELNLPPAKAFQERVNHPHMPSRDGRNIPIHSVRVFQDVHPETIGGTRQVQLRNNHHLEIFSKTDRNGKKMWRERIVSLLDAKHRLREHRPIIAKADEDGNPLIFSLAIGEAVELTLKGQKHLCVVQKITDSDYFFKFHNDARLDKERSKDKIRISGPNSLMKTNCQKVVVTPTGLIRYAND